MYRFFSLILALLFTFTMALGQQSADALATAAKSGDKSALQQLIALATAGNAVAQNNVGELYHTGEGVPQDLARAILWYRKAAESGLAIAQFNLGWAYANGEGVPEDAATAVQWYRKAAEHGSADARLELRKPITCKKPNTLEIPLQKQGGVFVAPASINGRISLDFIIDSGASDVNLPADVVLTLMRTGTLTTADFSGSKTYILANGSQIPSQTLRIRSLKIGDFVLNSVVASVGPPDGSLLLGQSFLSRVKAWSIDNARQVLLIDRTTF